MRSLSISVLSLTLTFIVIANAYYQKKQFYPSVVYITKSNPSMAVIYIQAFICVWISGKIMRKIFFGQLRSTEFEHLMERSWYAVTETCLAFTVFRDDFNPKFVALFTLLLFLKSFHWLAEDRVDYMERSPVISWLFHIRVLCLLLLLGSMDLHFIQHAYQSTLSKGASVQLVFGFEYAILLTVVINIAIKYALHSVDLNSETPWDNKAVFLLYTELVMGLIKVIFYVAFVAIMVRIYTLPLFAFRPMYYTIRNFKKAFSDVILSRRAIHNMNTLYPDATPEELLAADNVCIICREEMTSASKKLPCNHIFHTSCLRSWFQRQQTCPTCRLNILRTSTNNNNNARPAPEQRPAPPNPQNAFVNPFVIGPNPFELFNQPNLRNLPQMPEMPNQQQPAANAASSSTTTPQTQSNMPPLLFPHFPFIPNNASKLISFFLFVLLDAAVIMMQQYNTTATLSARVPQGVPPQAPETNQPQTNNATSASNHNSKTVSTDLPASLYESPKETKNSSVATTSDGDSKSSTVDPSSKPCTSSEPSVDTNEVTPEEEVRRRRLQRFQLQNEH
ncbi:E3 ubiquitin-protein ligase synoviolin A [Anoplophora glabripennis]|uniref:E3 ubiquitin-protein ligase synoviolin A n=1 Tax=Anoplophora glabripennis TaxID=217634 RepID=UPI000C787852|nr:E3 ubiquitin-protein ligase synoviolin A [Anoplophora glabripennis]